MGLYNMDDDYEVELLDEEFDDSAEYDQFIENICYNQWVAEGVEDEENMYGGY